VPYLPKPSCVPSGLQPLLHLPSLSFISSSIHCCPIRI
jgi:hypothetical protein